MDNNVITAVVSTFFKHACWLVKLLIWQIYNVLFGPVWKLASIVLLAYVHVHSVYCSGGFSLLFDLLKKEKKTKNKKNEKKEGSKQVSKKKKKKKNNDDNYNHHHHNNNDNNKQQQTTSFCRLN